MSNESVQQQSWSGALGFILTSIGYCVGLGAIWKFPYMIGTNGGGIFLLLCIILAVLVAIPFAWAELTLGRYTQKSAILCMRELAGNGSPWVLVGYLGFAASFVMISYYITIVSDVGFYFFKYLSRGLSGMGLQELGTYYDGLQINMPFKLISVLIVFVLTAGIIIAGVQKGLERSNKIFIPALFFFLIILAVRGLMLPGGMDGVVWMFKPDWSLLSGSVVLGALNQCFFLGGMGLATLYSFGAYLDKDNSDIPFSGSVFILSNMVVAILAGLSIFPSMFSYGMQENLTAGAGLVFKTLPCIFDQMSGGLIWGSIFFILLFFAGFSSILGLAEGSFSSLSDAIGWSRTKGVVVLTVLCFLLSLLTIFSTTALVNVKPLGMDLFTFMDFLAMCILCPIGCILTTLFITFRFGFEKFRKAGSVGAKYFEIPKFLKLWYAFLLPAVTVIVMIWGIASYF